ncbi:MAG TPA: 2-isopropylmalate synthase, partial [Spirochaetia bacterium]|nr:2-isopropylmalate synthase [Spirochaetia bacterium]
MDRVQIFDTTLRDGEQSPGASMSVEQKLEMAVQIGRLGVDAIEAGFPISSPHQFEGCRLIAQQVKNCIIAGLARTLEKDIDAAAEAIRDAVHPRIHTFIATSPIHMKYKLRKEPDEVLAMAVDAVRQARNKVAEVEFSPEDATRSEIPFLCKIIEKVIDAGATIINIPDTVGYAVPDEFSVFIKEIMEGTPNISKAVVSVHCHNDLGLAVANSVAAVQVGARQVEVTINGIGERAGNASLEEFVMALTVRKDRLPYCTGVNTKQIYNTSRLLANTIGFPIPRNKPITGENAFAHESGIHQDGVL